ncbi:hypothetical protein QTP88_023943 [Uroleucon formosanum]
MATGSKVSLDKVTGMIPICTGERDVHQFIRACKLACSMVDKEDITILTKCINTKLFDRALEVCRYRDVSKWEGIKLILLDAFEPQRTASSLQVALNSVRMRNNEDVSSYAHRVEQLYFNLCVVSTKDKTPEQSIVITEQLKEQTLVVFLKGLIPSLRTIVKSRNPPTLEAAMQLAKEEETELTSDYDAYQYYGNNNTNKSGNNQYNTMNNRNGQNREASKYRFALERGEIPIKFMGCPLIIKDHINYECVNGPEQKPEDNYLTILDCLKNDIEMGKQIVTKNKYLIHVSLLSVHNHVIETSLLNFPIDKSVYNEISKLPFSEEDGIIKQLLFCQQIEWQRYLLDMGNLNIKENQNELLILWRNIANSRNNFELIHKVEKMKLTDAWLKNPKAQDYIIRTWLTVEEKWTTQNIYSEKRINKLALLEHHFEVQSENGSNVYVVDFTVPSCTCLDFEKYHWPCKYLCALFIYVPGYSFNDLPEKFKNNVHLSADPRYSITSPQEDISSIDLNMQNTTTATPTRLILKEQKITSAENIDNNSNLPIQSREILKKITDLTHLIDQKEYSAEWSKQLEVLNCVYEKISGMANKEDGLNLLPSKRNSRALLDLPKTTKKKRTN